MTVKPTGLWTKFLAKQVRFVYGRMICQHFPSLQTLWFTSRRLLVRLQTSRPCLGHHQPSSLLLLLLVRMSSESYPFFSSVLPYSDFLILLLLFSFPVTTFLLVLLICSSFVYPRKLNIWTILIICNSISMKIPQWISKYWTIAPWGNTGLGSWQHQVTTSLLSNQYVIMYYVCFCLKTMYLIYIVDSLTLNSWPTAVFPIRHIAASMYLGTQDRSSLRLWPF